MLLVIMDNSRRSISGRQCRRRNQLAVVLLAACLLSNAASAGATNWYVSGKGNNAASGNTPSTAFATLQHAADLTHAGDTVYVMDGSYEEPTANAVLTIKTGGAANHLITYAAYPGTRPVLRVGGKNWNGIMIDKQASYIVISGFTVIGNSATLNLADALRFSPTPAQHPDYNNNGISIGSNPAMPPYPTHIQILNNTVSDCPGAGISTMFADYVTIAGNTISNVEWFSAYGGSAISNLASYDSNPADTATRYKMVISGNVIHGAEEFVPWVGSGAKPVITDGEGIIIDSNHARDYDKKIPFAPYSGRTLIANNVIYNGGSSAVWIYQSGHVDVVNNSTFNNDLNQDSEDGRGEIGLNRANDVSVFNNILYSSAGGNPFTMLNACADCEVDHNLYFGGENAWHGFGKNGPHDIVANPMYLNTAKPSRTGNATRTTPQPDDLRNAPASVNLRLKPTSPAIGKATKAPASKTVSPASPLTGPPIDVEGKPRGDADRYDLGAYFAP